MPNNLQNCPFCGEDAYIDPSEDGTHWKVVCIGCGASTDDFRSEAKAIAAWNKRPTAPKPKLFEYTVNIILSELTIKAESPEQAEEIAMEIYEGDARTHLTHGLLVECCDVECRGESEQ